MDVVEVVIGADQTVGGERQPSELGVGVGKPDHPAPARWRWRGGERRGFEVGRGEEERRGEARRGEERRGDSGWKSSVLRTHAAERDRHPAQLILTGWRGTSGHHANTASLRLA